MDIQLPYMSYRSGFGVFIAIKPLLMLTYCSLRRQIYIRLADKSIHFLIFQPKLVVGIQKNCLTEKVLFNSIIFLKTDGQENI